VGERTVNRDYRILASWIGINVGAGFYYRVKFLAKDRECFCVIVKNYNSASRAEVLQPSAPIGFVKFHKHFVFCSIGAFEKIANVGVYSLDPANLHVSLNFRYILSCHYPG
jgi:hypothetical protein